MMKPVGSRLFMAVKNEFTSFEDFGSDSVETTADGVILHSRSPKDSYLWRIKKFRKTRIIIHQESFFIERITEADDGNSMTLDYYLKPWPRSTQDIPGHVIEFTDTFVTEQEKLYASQANRIKVGWGLLLLSPLLGCLFEEKKLELEKRFFYPARLMNRNSVYIQFLGSICVCVLFVISMFAGGLSSGKSPLSISALQFLLATLLVMDVAVRFVYMEFGECRFFGVFEWLWESLFGNKKNTP